MHILYLHQYFATPNGSTGTRSYEFARRWVAAGHRVTMLTSVAQLTEEDLPAGPRRLVTRFDVEGIGVIALNIRYHQRMGFARRAWSFLLFTMMATWQIMLLSGVDMVYASSTPLTIGIPALAARWFRGRRFVFEVRDPWPAVPIAMGIIRNVLLIKALRLLEKVVYRNAESIVALSGGMAELVRAVAPSDARVETIPNCADTDRFRPDVDRTGPRNARGWDDRFVCIHAGAMGRVNNLDSIIDAADKLRHDPAFLFVLVGEGSEKVRLQQRVEQLALTNVEFIERTSKREMPALLAGADVGLVTIANLPVIEHNSANKLFDYLSAGKPVVLNYSGWQREMLESSGAGIGSALGDQQAFVDALVSLEGDAPRRRSMSERSRKLATEQFNRDLLAQRALDVVADCAKR